MASSHLAKVASGGKKAATVPASLFAAGASRTVREFVNMVFIIGSGAVAAALAPATGGLSIIGYPIAWLLVGKLDEMGIVG